MSEDKGRPVLPHRSGGGYMAEQEDIGHMQIAMAAANATPPSAAPVAQATLEYEIELPDGTPSRITCHGSERDMKRLRSRLEYFHNREAELRALLASAPAGAVGDGWMPIETAPKDGTSILLGRLRAGSTLKAADGYWADCWAWPYVLSEPTHWCALPPAPAATKEEA